MPSKTNKPIRIIAIVIIMALIAAGVYTIFFRDSSTTSSKKQQAAFNKQPYSVTDPSSPWVIVNKHYALPATYTPTQLVVPPVPLREASGSPEMQLRADVSQPLQSLITAAKNDGVNLMLVSGFRSYDAQKEIYNRFVKEDGQAKADMYSARPGHSEHQTGLAVDLGFNDRKCELETCFGDTTAGKWIAQHANDYGFVLRYQKNTQNIVGYEYEPWHIRYVGIELAKAVKQSGKTLEEFFNLPAAPGYN